VPKTWWDRNWFWVVPGGCLGCLGLALGSCALLLGGMLGMVRSSDVGHMALERARSHPEVVEALGEPIDAGWLVSGQFAFDEQSGSASLVIPISGPRGSGRIHVEAHKTGGQWRFDSLDVEIEGRDEPIQLLAPGDPSSTARAERPPANDAEVQDRRARLARRAA